MNKTSIAIDVATLRKMLDERRPLTILDVRPSEEREELQIPGSVHVDAYAALNAGDPSVLTDLDLPKDRPVVSVCAAGRTALLAALQLRAQGYDAWSLSGGMEAWSRAWNSALLPLKGTNASVVQVRRTGKGCLSYVVGSDNQSVVIDAALDPDVYIDLASRHGWRIVGVVDTHIHADHLSRSRILAERTGATLYLPEQDRVNFPFEPLRDGQVVAIGGSKLQAIHTPGHTSESTSYLLDDQAVFTGDTLFLEGVGRPDLEATPDQARARARLLYSSLQKFTQLPGSIFVLPGHTSSSVAFDGQPLHLELNAVKQRLNTLDEDEDGFVSWILGRTPPTPANHHLIVQLNEAGLLPGVENQTGLEAGANRCAVS